MLLLYRPRPQRLDGFYDREPAARCAANFMSGLCPTPSDFANKKFGLNHFFYPQSCPQDRGVAKTQKSRRSLFSGADRCGKSRPSFSLWKTMAFEVAILNIELRLIVRLIVTFESRSSCKREACFRCAILRATVTRTFPSTASATFDLCRSHTRRTPIVLRGGWMVAVENASVRP